tara:strand:- start:20 stop:1060 length:1041 start_codon:yes stop_codon:yes gene_type:complete
MPFQENNITHFPIIFGRNLLAELDGFVLPKMLVVTMEDLWPIFEKMLPRSAEVYFVKTLERSELETELLKFGHIASFVGLGGGQAIDVAKYFSWRLTKPLFQFPTSLSVDAVFGHRAGVREKNIVRYVGWAIPQSIYIDYGIIDAAPRLLNIGGIGDIFCFYTGVMDWKYAATLEKCEKRWPYDESLAQISLKKAETALNSLLEIKNLTPRGIEIMVDALRWGGASYHAAGWNPRHIEGVEHFIFYALEAQTEKKFLHGQAVCLGLILGSMMHQQRTEEFLQALVQLCLDIRPYSMGVSWQDVNLTMKNLREFVHCENLPYGIAHDFEVTDSFLSQARQTIESAFE